MKRYFIRITALVLCCLLIVQISAATPITTEVVDLDNLAQVNAFVESGRIFDFLYYSSTELALFMMSIRHSDFAALCENRATITSLHYLIASEGDELTNHLLSIWCTYLEGKFGIATPSTLSHSENKPCSKCQTYCIDYTLEVPSGETIDALKYTGPSETPTRNDMSSYPSAVQLYSGSHSYNCHSFAWYLHGNPYSKMQLKFETPDGFIKNGSCAQRVSTPRIGDIVVYRAAGANAENAGQITHSAIVTSVSNGTGVDQIIVKSKWNCFPAYRHILSDCPYYGRISGPIDIYVEIEYYRISHVYTIFHNYYVCKHCGYDSGIPATR